MKPNVFEAFQGHTCSCPRWLLCNMSCSLAIVSFCPSMIWYSSSVYKSKDTKPSHWQTKHKPAHPKPPAWIMTHVSITQK